MENYTVYRHTNKTNGKVYVGITGRSVEERWRNGSAYKDCKHFNRAIQKYGWDGFSHEILYSNLSREQAQKIEIELIAFYQSSECGSYNILSGGNLSRTGMRLSEDAREKLRQLRLGKPLSEEHKQKLRAAHTGKMLSEETRRKMSENNARYWKDKKRDSETVEKIRVAHLGKTLSDEHRAKITASQPRDRIATRKKKSVLQMDLSGRPIQTWPSMKEAELALRGRVTGGISACCQGKFETAFGYKWKILNDEGEYK